MEEMQFDKRKMVNTEQLLKRLMGRGRGRWGGSLRLKRRYSLKQEVSWGRYPDHFSKFSPSWLTNGKFTCVVQSSRIH